MSELERWSFASMTYPSGVAGMRIHPDGNYVQYAEYKTLATELAKTKEKLEVAQKALKSISVFDVYDCSLSEDINYHDEAKIMYETAHDALIKIKQHKG